MAFDPQVFMNLVLSKCAEMNQELIQTMNQSHEAFTNQFTQSHQEVIARMFTQIEEVKEGYLKDIAASANIRSPHLSENTSHQQAMKTREHHVQRAESSIVHGEKEATPVHVPETPVHVLEEDRVHEPSELLPLSGAQKSERVSREQVCRFIRTYWREHQSQPTIKFIRKYTGCSQGLASNCRQLLTLEMST